MNMTLSEYALLVLEGQQDETEHQRLKECVQKHMRHAGRQWLLIYQTPQTNQLGEMFPETLGVG